MGVAMTKKPSGMEAAWALAAMLAGAVLAPGAPTRAQAPSSPSPSPQLPWVHQGRLVEPLGAPLADALTLGGTVAMVPCPTTSSQATCPRGRIPVLYTVVSGPVATLAGVDLGTLRPWGEPLTLPHAQGAWALATAPNGDVYVGTYEAAHLWRYRPSTHKLQDLGPLGSERYVFALDIDPVTGWVWIGTFPSGSLFHYEPATGRLVDHGPLDSQESYVRSVAAYGGKVYAGLGDARPELWVYDPSRDRRRLLPIPGGASRLGPGTVTAVELLSPRLLYVKAQGAWLLSLPSGHLVRRLPSPASEGLTRQGDRGQVFFVARQDRSGWPGYGRGWIAALRLRDGRVRAVTSPRSPFAPYLWEPKIHGLWLLRGPQGPSLVGLEARGYLWRYDLRTGYFARFLLPVPRQPEILQRLGPGPRGTDLLYGSGYLAGDTFSFHSLSPQRGLLAYPGPGQAEGLTAAGPYVYLGTYPGGRLWRYDPRRPWAPAPGALPGGNPRPVATLGHGQIRPFRLMPWRGGILVGSVPAYGRFGGRVSWFDPRGRVWSRPALPREAPIALAPAPGGEVVGGTTVSGGNPGGPPFPQGGTDAHLFALSLQDWRGSRPLPQVATLWGVWAVDALQGGPQGWVYGVAGHLLFAFDPLTWQMVRVVALPGALPPPHHASRYYDWGLSTDLVWGADAKLYVLSARAHHTLFAVDPPTFRAVPLMSGVTRLGTDPLGTVYVARGEELFRLLPLSSPSGPGPTIVSLHPCPALPGSYLTLTVRGARGQALSLAFLPGQEDMRHPLPTRFASARAVGSGEVVVARLPPLPPGRYEVSLQLWRHGRLLASPPVLLEVRSGA
jgi:hypothetical protein